MRSLLIGGAGLQLMEENKARADAENGKVAICPGEKIRTQASLISTLGFPRLSECEFNR